MKNIKKYFFNLFVSFCLFITSSSLLIADTAQPKPQVKTGTFAWSEASDKVILVVPENYTLGRSYPLIVAIPQEGQEPDELAKEWESVSERMSLIVMIPRYLLRSGSAPERMDDWLLLLRSDIMKQYKIAKNKIFLIAQGSSADYAGYLGMRYPEKFSAVALLEGSWIGAYQKMSRVQKEVRRQVPFYVALPGANTELLQQTESLAQQLQAAGYMVHIRKMTDKEKATQPEFKKLVYEWLNEHSDTWQDHVDQSKKTWKQKLKNAIRENFIIES